MLGRQPIARRNHGQASVLGQAHRQSAMGGWRTHCITASMPVKDGASLSSVGLPRGCQVLGFDSTEEDREAAHPGWLGDQAHHR